MKVCILVDPIRKKEIEFITQSTGWSLYFLPCEESASSMALEFRPDFILVDEIIHGIDSFETCKKIRELSSFDETPVFMLASENSLIEDIDIIRFGIDSIVPSNLSGQRFKSTIEEKIILKKSFKKNEFVENWIEFEIDNDLQYVKEVHVLVEKLIIRTKLPPTEIFKLEYSFKEMLQNAWEHGNGKDIKKKIKVSYVLFGDRLIIKISDEGSGFLLGKIEDPTVDPIGAMIRRQKEGKRSGGWGIASVRKIMDELIFSEAGNIVLMVKYLNNKVEEEVRSEGKI